MTVKIYFSDFFGVEPEILEEYGAFNISLINDLPLFVDPFLLFNSPKPEYQALHSQIINYVRFLKDVSRSEGIDPGFLESWFQFPEIRQNWFGYSLIGNQGRGLGMDFAQSLSRNLYTIFQDFGNEEITKSSHLEKLCLIKDGVGRDNISDFTTNLILNFLLEYTQNFAKRYLSQSLIRGISINKVRFNYKTRIWERERFILPFYASDYVLLTPKDILTKDDTWINRSDLVNEFLQIADSIPNNQLRAQISSYFLQAIQPRREVIRGRARRKPPTKKEIQQVVSQIIEQHPEILDYYIRYKENRGDNAKRISEQKVQETETIFITQITRFVEQLNKLSDFYKFDSEDTTYDESLVRVNYLKDVIENKGGHRIFYHNGKPIRRESDLQILFRLVWFGTPSDVSREVNDGRGPADFKISRGSQDKTLVEFKLGSNTQLKKNLEKQSEIYEKASDAKVSIKVILYFDKYELRRVQEILRDLRLIEHKNVILIDARLDNKPSGSKA